MDVCKIAQAIFFRLVAEVVPDWHNNFVDFFSIKWRNAVESNMASLEKSLKEIRLLCESDPDNDVLRSITSIDEAKINDALKYYKWLHRLIDSFETGDIFTFIPKEE